MNELIDNVSWIGVGVSFFISFFLGWLWYSPKMFGKKWAEGVGVDMENCGDIPVFAMVTQALGTLGLAWLFGIMAVSNALLTIVLILLTVILLIVSNGKYAQKSNTAVAIEAAYIFVMGVIMLVCQGIF